ncbi:MAG: hypothetical protein M3Y86_04260, partial [Verrucomicrobiota bacterium]|nr:hypothetical protein [Verrucomicrobiota bacterium]
MKVQTKISLLLVAVVATFLVGLWAFRAYDRLRFRHVAEERFQERNRSLQDFLNYHGQQLETLVRDFTAWDSMVNAIARNDRLWFDENVNTATLDSYHANAIWI